MNIEKLGRIALLLILLATSGLAFGAEEVAEWGTIKNLYHSGGGTITETLLTPTSYWIPDDCPLQPTSEPTSYCWQLPDGSWISIADLLSYVQSKTPDEPIWRNSGFLDWQANGFEKLDMSALGERSWLGDFWDWVKSHVSGSVNGFGLNIQITGNNPNDCFFIDWNWFTKTVAFGPC